MKNLRRITLVLLVVLLIIPAVPVYADAPDQPGGEPSVTPQGDWAFLRWGIDWQLFHLTNPRPVDIFVARMHRVTQTATIDTGIAPGEDQRGSRIGA